MGCVPAPGTPDPAVLGREASEVFLSFLPRATRPKNSLNAPGERGREDEDVEAELDLWGAR